VEYCTSMKLHPVLNVSSDVCQWISGAGATSAYNDQRFLDSSIDRQGIQLSKIRFQRRKSQIIDSSASLFPISRRKKYLCRFPCRARMRQRLDSGPKFAALHSTVTVNVSVLSPQPYGAIPFTASFRFPHPVIIHRSYDIT
jgi:hypothetical protein